MRLFFVNRYYWPDESATSLMLTDLAQGLAAAGHEVHIVTSRQRLEDPAAGLPGQAEQAGVHIHRVATTTFGRARLLTRAVDYLSFYVTAFFSLLRQLRRGDLVIAKTDPPMLGVMALVAARLRGARLINWLQDVYPEIAFGLGALEQGSRLGLLMARLRDYSLRGAVANVAVGERMRHFLEHTAPGCAPVTVIGNWSPPLASSPAPRADNPYRRQLGLLDHVVVAYSGNLGRAHEFVAILDAANELKALPKIRFLIIGNGAQMQAVQQEALVRGLENFSFLPYQPRERLHESLGAADVHLVSLNPAMEGLIVPSKIYGVLAAGRPCLFIGDRTGEVATLIERHDCGWTATGRKPGELAQHIMRLAQSPELRREMGLRAVAAHREYHLPAHAVAAWQRLLDELPAGRS